MKSKTIELSERQKTSRWFTKQSLLESTQEISDKLEVIEYVYEDPETNSEKPPLSFDNLYKTPQQYIDALSQNIPLSQLYEVKDCFCENAANEYCAVTLQVKNTELQQILQLKNKKDDRILKVYNKEGNLVYQRTIAALKQSHVEQATDPKYELSKRAIQAKTRNIQPSPKLTLQESERSLYPYIALFQNILIIDPRENVPTGSDEVEQSVLNIIKLDHRKGTRVVKLRFAHINENNSLDYFANISYLDKNLIFLVYDKQSKQYSMKLMKLNIDALFEGEDGDKLDGQELARHEDDAKQCVQVFEVLKDDLIDVPVLTKECKYYGFIDIGYNVTTVQKFTGKEENEIVEGVALVEEYKGRITFQELQIKLVQKRVSAANQQSEQKGKKTKNPLKTDRQSYANDDWEPKVLLCNLSLFQSLPKTLDSNAQVQKIVSRMYYTRDERQGKQLHHSSVVQKTNKTIEFYNEFSFVGRIKGEFEDTYADFDNFYLAESVNAKSFLQIESLRQPKRIDSAHIWKIPTVMSNKASDTIQPTNVNQLLVRIQEKDLDDLYVKSSSDSRNQIYVHTLQQQIRSWVKLIPDFCQVGEFFVLAHDRFVSVFSNQQWIFHEQCPDQVIFLTPKGICSGREFNQRKNVIQNVEESAEDFEKEETDSEFEDNNEKTRQADDDSVRQIEYDEDEQLYEVRVVFGLGKVTDLVFPKSMNKKSYRDDVNSVKQNLFELRKDNDNLPYRIFQPMSHPQIGGVIFFLTDECPFVNPESHTEISKGKYGKEEVLDKRAGATAISTANSMLAAIRKKEQMVNQTFKIPSLRSEIFFKFTGYNYKIASAWKITLSKKLPLLPFQLNYECVVLPKNYNEYRPRKEFQLWMITKEGEYKRIWFSNDDIKLEFDRTRINLQYNKMDQRIILHLMTRTHVTNVLVFYCKCGTVKVQDYSFLLCTEDFSEKTKDNTYLRPEDFRTIQCGYRFHLSDIEFEEDNDSSDEESCDCKTRNKNDPEGSFAEMLPDFFANQDGDNQSYLRVTKSENGLELNESDEFDRASGDQQMSVQTQLAEEEKFRQLRIQHSIQSECLNNKQTKKDYDLYDKKFKLMLVYILDGRVYLLKPDWNRTPNKQEENVDIAAINLSINSQEMDSSVMSRSTKPKPKAEQANYNYLKVIRKGPNMNIRAALDSGDEQDFIYALSDGFEEAKAIDLDDYDEKKIQIQALEQVTGLYTSSCLMTLDIRHFAKKLELNFRSIKPAISGVNSKIMLDGDAQATLIMDNYIALGRQPTAHSNKIMFCAYPKFNKKDYQMVIERHSQEFFEVVTTKNEIYKWQVLTGRLLSTTKDPNLRLDGMKQSKNRTQHFKDFSVRVAVKDELTELFEYHHETVENELREEAQKNDDEKSTFFVPIEDASTGKSALKKGQKPLRSRDKLKLRKATYTTKNQKRVYVVKLFDCRTPETELRNYDQNIEKFEIDPEAHISHVTVPFWFDHSILDDRVSIKGLYKTKQVEKDKKKQSEKQKENETNHLKTPVIKFTEELEKMLVVTETDSVIIFKKEQLVEPDQADLERVPEMKWRVLHVINDLHGSILKRSRELFLFDPKFEYYFNVQYNVNSFVVYKLNEASKLPTVHKRIDPRFFNIELEGNKSIENMQRLVSRMQIIDDQRIRIVSHSGLDSIYNYMNDQIEAYIPIQDFQTIYGQFKDKHQFLQPEQLPKNAIVLRLLQQNFEYQRHIKFMEQLDPAIFKQLYECQNRFSTQTSNLEDYRHLERNLKIFNVEKYYNKKLKSIEPFVQQSFTLLDWIAIDEFTNASASNDHELMSEEGIVRIVFNQLPIHRSFLEMLVVGETQQKINIIKHFFQVCHQEFKEEGGLLNGRKIQIPLMRNLQGQTALDWTLQMDPVFVEEKNRSVACFDPILAEELLRGIKNYEIFTIQEVYTAIPRAIEFGIPFLPDFLELRMKRSNYFNSQEWGKNYFYKNSNSLLFDLKKTITSEEETRVQKQTTYVTSNCFSAWPNKRLVAKQLFLSTNDVKAYGQIDFRVLDIPHLHNMESPIGEDFIAQLCIKNDPTLFLKYSVSAIIQERFQRSQKYFMIYQFVPFAIYLFLFNVWLHYVYINDIDQLRSPIVKVVAPDDSTIGGLRSLAADFGAINYTSRLLAEELAVSSTNFIDSPIGTGSAENRSEETNSNSVQSEPVLDSESATTETQPTANDPKATAKPTTASPDATDQEKPKKIKAQDYAQYEIVLIAFGLYFVICGLFQMLWPAVKGFTPWYDVFATETLYLNVLPNLVIILIFVLHLFQDNETIAKLIQGNQFKLRKRQLLGLSNCILQTRLLFNLKSSKMFGENLMVIMHILKKIPVFFGVFFTLIYVLSDFIWITSNKLDSDWNIQGESFLISGASSFHRMMTLSLYGNIAWLDITYGSSAMKIYYLIIWVVFTLVTNVIMFNLLVSSLTAFYQEFKTNEDVVLKLVQAQTVQNMIFIEKFVLYIKSLFNKKGRFQLRKEYFHIALHSSNYAIESELPSEEAKGDEKNVQIEKKQEKKLVE